MDQNEFNKVEKIRLISPTRVMVKGADEAKLYGVDEVVEVAGNDKVQLLGSKAGIRVEDKEANAAYEKEKAEKEKALKSRR